MSDVWTHERVLGLAPDAASAKAASGLAHASKWTSLGRSDAALWGEVQGSGKDPYRARVDLRDAATKCSCPSRKFPCKHGLALLLMHAAAPATTPVATPPDWVAEWLASRAEREEARAAREAKADATPADPAARARRAAAREGKVAAGLDELRAFLDDLVRQGLASAHAASTSPWERLAARLVDAQAAGAAALARRVGAADASGDAWPGRVLRRVGALHLLVEAHGRVEGLDPALAADVRAAIGWTTAKEEVADGPGVRDVWVVVGQSLEADDRLQVLRTWLWGTTTDRPAMVLSFAVGRPPVDEGLTPGLELEAELAFFPGAAPLRALVRARLGAARAARALPGHATVRAARTHAVEALGRNPWLERWPMPLRGVSPLPEPGPGGADGERALRWWLVDADGDRLPVAPSFAHAWGLLALAGDGPVDVFGVWDGEAIAPLSVGANGRFLALPRADATLGFLAVS